MPVYYRLPEETRHLIICLFNPSGSSVDTQYTFSSLSDYIQDCACQLEHGENVKRLPYHIAPCRADALRAQEDFRRIMTALRKEKTDENIHPGSSESIPCTASVSVCTPDISVINTDHTTSNIPTTERIATKRRTYHRADHAFVRRKA